MKIQGFDIDAVPHACMISERTECLAMVDEKPTYLVPFGKYKGQPIEQLLADQPYLDWLTAQDWFRRKYQNVYAVIINYPGKPSETPAHNQMQVKFLKRKYQLKLALLLLGADLFKWNQAYFDSNIGALLENAKREKENYGVDYVAKKLKEALLRNDGIDLLTITSPVFEDRGTDVSYVVRYGYSDFSVSDEENFCAPKFFRTLWSYSTSVSLRIELKPQVGDDFPAVLRQLKADRSNVLVLREYTGSGASWDEFVNFFASQGITVVLEADIEEVVVPKFDLRLRVDLRELGLVQSGGT